jgi:hypothetical protein
MPALYTPAKRTIGELLTMTNPPIVVPQWQRNYSWTVSEVDTFWKDLLGFEARYPERNIDQQEYFLGSIVIVDQNVKHLLLDGQQRLATAAILLSVIRDFLARYDNNAAVRTTTRYLVDYDDARRENKYKLTLNQYDRDFFRREILEARTPAHVPLNAQLESHKLIRKARKYFEDAFTAKYAELGEGEIAHTWAVRIQEVLVYHFSVVAVYSTDEDNAATVFETLNDRGIGLSTPDLVRNLLLRRANDGQREEIIDLWRVILDVEADAKLGTFLRHFWIKREGDVKGQSLYREIRDTVQAQAIDSLDLSRALQDSSLIYRDIVNARDDDEEIRNILHDIDSLGASVLYPALMSAYERLDRDAIKLVARALLVTFVRHIVVAGLDSSQLESVVFDTAHRLGADLTAYEAVTRLREFTPDDDRFQAQFETASFPKVAFARYILRELEHSKRATEELRVAPPSRVHVEHIYPQNPPAGQKWDNHSQVLNRLGNLTLLSRALNAAIRNGPFDAKRNAYANSEILITRDLLNYVEWTPATIAARQTALSQRATEIWKYPEMP